ncbi:MBG domain-containing protein [Phytopseudomonas dryadis]|uniref:Filamentous haemagglutinin FhaB/tRNA nuclease CdiA-like TPS domain-containing protein n=1 Tax=Phytopseudomonas dryadis TaxID=2487520 RepID=A0A4Q9QWJ4_9GAMM|nr:MBG domain-containing protein [Pseudomonas dryadis]TBU88656.1 hypothetical protein DNK44_18150 [Pseudomonas dryadis]
MWHHGSINRAYRLVFNRARGTWAVAPETARGQGKAAAAVGGATVTGQFAFSARRLRLAILAGLGLLALPSSGFALDAGALPSGGKVIAGQADIGQSGTSLTVNQGSDRAIIDWQSFDIGKDASVRFNQPGAHAAALNRVTGGSRSQILGNLSANGQVYLVNGAGVLFGQSAQVDVGGIVASTLAISNEDFLAGKDRFTLTENSTGEVINQGSITATNGTVALLGTSVSNTGNIQADGGNAILAAGREITFAAGADGHLQIAVDASELQLAVHNGGAIVADGGQIVLNAQGANALASAVVSNSGTLQARTLAEREGRILLLADLDSGGRAEVAGTLDASAPAASNPKGGNGGFVETSAAKVSIAAGTRVSTKAEQGQTGTWLIDPTDFTVAAGSATKTDSGIGAETLNANLANTSVTLQTVATGSEAGDINVDAAVAWNSDTTLTLNAHGDININAAITATGESAGLVLNHGGYAQNGTVASGSDYNISAPVTLSGSNASLSINGEAYTLIHSMTQLDAIDSTGLGGRYALAQDLDASGTTYGQAVVGSTFTGIFAGLGHSISDLTIESAHGYLGLFGSTGTDALIRDIGLLGGSVTGTGTGYNHLGGLVGYNYGGTISNAYATGSVTGTGANNYLGGLVGINVGNISNAYATGSVNGTGTGTNNRLGGLVGNNVGTITNAYATGSVNSTGTGTYNHLGGLVGYNNNGTITNAYATGSMTGTGANNYLGGLVGYNYSGTISNAYATGSMTGSGTNNILGGLVGYNGGTISDAFYATTDANGNLINSGSGYNALGTAKTLAELQDLSTFAAWGSDIDAQGGSGSVWRIYDGYTTPLLRSFLTQVTVSADLSAAGKTYDGSAASGTSSYTTDLTGASLDGSLSYATDSKNAGTYSTVDGNLIFDGLYSGQQGYDIRYANAELAIDKADLTVTGLSANNKTYDGTAAAALTGTASVTAIGTDVIVVAGTGTGTFNDKNAGTDKTVTVTGYTLSGTDADNYNLLQPTGLTATINKAQATVTANSATRTYNGQQQSVTGFTASGLVNGESESVLADVTTSGGSGTNAGSYLLTASGSDGNYALTFVDGTLAIGKAQATVIANSATRTYNGQQQSVSGFTASGLVNGESESVLAGVTTSGGSGTNAGSYLLSASGSDGNYALTFVDGALTIDKAAATVIANSATRTYNGQQQSVTGFTASGLVNGETESVLSGVTTSGGSGTNAGSYLLTASGSDGNYALTFVDGALTIGKAQATVTANSTTRTYNGQQQSVSGFTASGLVNGESESVLAGVITSGGSGTNAGSYLLTASGSDGNYELTFVDGALTIDKAQATVIANSTNVTYNGQQQSVTGFTANGLVNGESESVLAGVTTNGGSGTNAGSYLLTASGSDGNYALTFVDGALTIDKAAATVIANSATTTYNGQQQNVSGFTASGLVNGEDTSVLSGVTTSGGSGTNAGSYLLTASGSDGNYELTFVDGALTIGKAQATVIANSASVTYNGQQQSVAGFTASGLVNGESESVLAGITTSGGSSTNAGSYLLSASGSDGNYALTFVDGALTIDKAALTVTANDAGKTYNGLAWSGGNGVTYSGFVGGETDTVLGGSLVYGGSAQGAVNAGSYGLSASGLTSGNYAIAYVDAGLVIDPKAITVTANGGRSTYGDTNQANPGFTASGLVEGQDESVLTGLGNSFAIDNSSNAGSYTLTVAGTLSNGNYLIGQRHGGTWIVDRAQLSITANDAAKVYDGTAFQGGNGVRFDGFVNGEDASVLGGQLVYGGSAQGAVQVGDYSIGVSGLAADNYAIAYLDGRLLIVAQPEVPPLPGTPAGPTAGDIERPVRQDERARLARVGMAGDGAARQNRNMADLPLQVAENFIRLEE